MQEKGTWQIVEYVQLNTMFVVYIHHFASYNKEKTKVTQLIPLYVEGYVWKIQNQLSKFWALGGNLERMDAINIYGVDNRDIKGRSFKENCIVKWKSVNTPRTNRQTCNV